MVFQATNYLKNSKTYCTERVIAEGWNEIAIDLQAFDMEAYIACTNLTCTRPPNKISEKIPLQKLMPLFCAGREVWSVRRRSGVPEVSPRPNLVNGSDVPIRFENPNSLRSINNTNYHQVHMAP